MNESLVYPRAKGLVLLLGTLLVTCWYYIRSDGVESIFPSTRPSNENTFNTTQGSVVSNSSHSSVWLDNDQHAAILIHYHKTGHDISHHLVKYIDQTADIPESNQTQAGPKRTHDEHTKCTDWQVRNNSLFVQTAPNLFCDLDNTKILPSYTRVLHMVREPLDWAMSNYLYHSQNPTPEKWIYTVDPCSYNDEVLHL